MEHNLLKHGTGWKKTIYDFIMMMIMITPTHVYTF